MSQLESCKDSSGREGRVQRLKDSQIEGLYIQTELTIAMETAGRSILGTLCEEGEIVEDSLYEDYSIRIVKSGRKGYCHSQNGRCEREEAKRRSPLTMSLRRLETKLREEAWDK